MRRRIRFVCNVTNIDYAVSADVKFAYDALNRLTNMVDASGTNKFTYTAAGQLLTEDGPFTSDTLTNVYWSRMRTNLSLQQPTGVWTNAFGYSSTHRLTSVTSPAGAFSYTYAEPSTRLTSLSLPNSAHIDNAYDAMSRLTNTALVNSSSAVLDAYLYAFNRESQRTNEVRNDNSSLAYSYDNIGQLKVANSSVNAEDRGYYYDAAWNLNRRTNNGTTTTVTVNSKNQLTAFGALDPYTYDGNGNLTQVGEEGVEGTMDYTYDDENRLTMVATNENILSFEDPVSGLWLTTFTYDGLGRLRKRMEYIDEVLQTTTTYIYDGWRVIQERNSANTPTISYTRGNDLSTSLEGAGGIGGLLARSHGYSSGNWSTHNFYFADGNGNVTTLINGSQSVVASYRYDPFGNIISKSGSLADANVYRFSSKEIHAKSGMYYYGYRFYEPNLQRWLNQDPIAEEGGINLYGFTFNNPVSYADSNGEWVFVAVAVLLLYEAIANAPGPEDPVLPPYHDAPDPLQTAGLCLNPVGSMGGAAIDLVGEQLGLPPEATAILGMVGKGKPFTKSVKDKAKELNRQKYGGKLVSEKSGDELVRGQRHQKGVRPPDNEAHVDHKIPRAQGGDNSLENAQILSRKENLQKGSKCEKP